MFKFLLGVAVGVYFQDALTRAVHNFLNPPEAM